MRDSEVGLETHFSVERREHFAGLGAISWEQGTFEEYLEEDLRVAKSDAHQILTAVSSLVVYLQGSNSRVKWSSRNSWVHDVCCSDGVGREQGNRLLR